MTDPSGRTLTYTYDPIRTRYPTQITASTGEYVTYTWENRHWVRPGQTPIDTIELTRVDYNDGSFATYEYALFQFLIDTGPHSGQTYLLPKLWWAQDTRAHGPMRAVQYDYRQEATKFEGGIQTESHYPDGTLVSQFWHNNANHDRTQTSDTRGDGPSRTLNIEKINGNHLLTSRSDFYGQFEYFYYDAKNYLRECKNQRGYSTIFTNEPILGRPTLITHPGNPPFNIQFTYTDNSNPYYIETRTDERHNMTAFTRDPTTHRVTKIDYKDPNGNVLAYETFAYDDFGLGLVKTHRMKNGAYVHYAYDSRGLLINKWNPTWSATPVDSEPKTHYDYYPNDEAHTVEWTDRVWQETDPRGKRIRYEYDRQLDGNGRTNPNGPAKSGRGLITKISYVDDTHGGAYPNGTYRSFGYNQFGDKVWEENEVRVNGMGQRTDYVFDDYGRVTSITDALSHSETFDFAPTTGGSSSSYSHTSNAVKTHTSQAGKVTDNLYDNNLRKIQTTQHPGGGQPDVITWLGYDEVGNQIYVTDPRGSGRQDSQYTTYFDYDERNRKWRIREPQVA